MGIVTLDKGNFKTTVDEKGILLVDCWAAWCGACKKFEPVFERVAEKNPGHTFAKLDAQSEKEIIEELGIENIPTLLLFRDGIMLLKQAGYLDEANLNDVVKQAEGLDMDAVRADMADEGRKD